MNDTDSFFIVPSSLGEAKAVGAGREGGGVGLAEACVGERHQAVPLDLYAVCVCVCVCVCGGDERMSEAW